MSAPTIEEQIAAVDASVSRLENSKSAAWPEMDHILDTEIANLRAAAETLKRMQWNPDLSQALVGKLILQLKDSEVVVGKMKESGRLEFYSHDYVDGWIAFPSAIPTQDDAKAPDQRAQEDRSQ